MNILRLLIFTPSVTFGLVPSEIFPWLMIYTFLNFNKININYLYWVVALVPWFLFGYFYFGFSESFRSLFAVINAITFFFLVNSLDMKEKEKLINAAKFIFFLSIFFGVLQFFQISIISDIIKYFVPRSSSEISLLEGISSRGVSGLSSEPARQALELCLILSMLLKVKAIKNPIFILAILGGYLLFINRSVTGLGIFMFLILIFAVISLVKMIRERKYFKLISIAFLSSILGVFSFVQLGSEFEKTRSGAIAFEILERQDQALQILIGYTGFRFSTVYASYTNISFLGYGLGSSKTKMNEFIKADNDLYSLSYYGERSSEVRARPTSLVASLILEIGIIGFLATMLLIKNSFKSKYLYSPFNTLCFFSLIFLGAAGNPIPVVLMCLNNE